MQSSDFGSLTTPGYAAGGLAQTSEATNRPRNPVLGGLSDLVGKMRGALNVEPHTLTTLGGTTINTPAIGFGDFLTGHSPELLNDLAHGSQMLTQGPSNGRPYIPELLPQRKQQVADLVNLGLNLQPLAHPTTAASKMGAKALAAMTKDFVNSMADAGTVPARTLAQAGAIRPKGGNWGGVSLDQGLGELGNRTRPEVQAWRDNQLKRYIKTYLGTAEDPLLKLEQEGKLHLTPEQLNAASPMFGTTRVPAAEPGLNGTSNYKLDKLFNGFEDGNELHQAATGRDSRTSWENLSDAMVNQTTGSNQLDKLSQKLAAENSSAITDPANYKPYDWMTKDPGQKVLDVPFKDAVRNPLGFDHVLDFLHQSDLSPEQLKHVSVPDAVRMTSDWNARMARQQADQEAGALAAGTKLHKEYPDGMKWVQIGGHTAEDGLPPNHVLEHTGSGNVVLKKIEDGGSPGNLSDVISSTLHISPEAATQAAWKPYVDQGLNAEGKAMGHCVGGYCDDVQAGTKIYSLRDKNNQPHVTIEANPQSEFANLDRVDDVAETAADLADKHGGPGTFQKYLDENYGGDSDGYYRDHRSDYGKYTEGEDAHELGVNMLERISPEAAQAYTSAPRAQTIQQIKGKQNAAPVAKYLPYVQDFVKSGNWSEVNDLHNTGLLEGGKGSTKINGQAVSMPDLQYYTRKDLADHFIDQGVPPKDAYQHSGYVEPLLDDSHPDALANRFPDYQPPDQ